MTAETQPIVIASSDPGLVKLVQLSLHAEGMTVVSAASAAETSQQVLRYRPVLVVAADDLPDRRVSALLPQLALPPGTGTIALLPRGGPADVAAALNAGADDCLRLPAHPDELIARMRAVIRRRTERRQAPVVRLGSVTIDLERRIVERNGRQVRVSRTEWDVLACICSRMGDRVLTEEILMTVWGEDARGQHARLRGWVSRVRRRLGATAWSPGPIKKVTAGYVVDLEWRPPDDEAPVGVAA